MKLKLQKDQLFLFLENYDVFIYGVAGGAYLYRSAEKQLADIVSECVF